MKSKKILIEYFPLILVEIYFVFTLYLLLLGPLELPIENKFYLVAILLGYNIFLSMGYIFCGKKLFIESGDDKDCINKYFYLILLLGFLATLILYKGITFTNRMSFSNFFDDVYRGIISPADARKIYAGKLDSGNYDSNIVYSFYLLFFAWCKFLILPYVVFFWTSLSLPKKILGTLVGFFGVFTTLASSVSAVIFNMLFAIAAIFVFLFMLSLHDGESMWHKIKRRLPVFTLSIFLMALCAWHFYSVKSGANAVTTMLSESPAKIANGAAGQSYLHGFGVTSKAESEGKAKTFLDDYYEKITFYIVNGYVGMAYSLNENFDSTYGVGHSRYLLHIFDNYLGFDFSGKTYQRKITDKWDENIFWHSFYSQWANDFSFYGVAIVMFLLGSVFSIVYRFALLRQNVFAICLIPLFFVMFIYMPANNQVFSFVETMTSFWILLILLWVFGKANLRIKR